MSYNSRLPQIEAELVAKMDAVVKTVAEQIEQAAKERVPVDTGRLRDAIHTDHIGPGEYSVVAGDNKAFYGHVVEHGGARIGGRPFLVPALEEARGEVPVLGRAALKSL